MSASDRRPAAPGPAVPSPPASGRGAPGLRRHLRAAGVLVLVGILILGVAYPWAVTALAEVLNPSGANGSLLYAPNGTVYGSRLVGENTSLPYLFWDRVSLTDYNTTAGYADFYGPSDPALLTWLNETIAYLRADWNLSLNQSLPLDLVTPSGSSLDPFLVPAGVLIQVPRVAAAIHTLTGLPYDAVVARLTALVNAAIEAPFGGLFGVAVIDVPSLDAAVLSSFSLPAGG
ncbi:MAG: potassium-transporting ATPase subunit C [Thermoplasmata archaeon]